MRSCRLRMSRSGSSFRGFTGRALQVRAYGAPSGTVNPLAQLGKQRERVERRHALGVGAAQLLERALFGAREQRELALLRRRRVGRLGMREPRAPLAVELGPLEVAQD